MVSVHFIFIFISTGVNIVYIIVVVHVFYNCCFYVSFVKFWVCCCFDFGMCILMLSGDVELNPGPATHYLKTSCRVLYSNIRGLRSNLGICRPMLVASISCSSLKLWCLTISTQLNF